MTTLALPKPVPPEPQPRKRIARSRRPRRQRKTNKAKAIREADILFSRLIRSRGECEAEGCGERDYSMLQCAHGYSRRYLKTRWSDWNAFCLCKRHHVYYTHRWEEWVVWMARKLGLSGLERVQREALDRSTTVDVFEVLERLRSQVQ